MSKTVTLKPNPKLLNANFDGYKLSSEANVTLYTQPLTEGVEKRKNSSNCYLRTRLEALHNYFFGDPFHPLCVYYFSNRGHLVKCNYSEDSRLSVGEVVWQADVSRSSEEGSEEDGAGSGQYHASVHFPSHDLAVVNNGQGSLHILETQDRTLTHSWLVSFESSTEESVIVHTCLQAGSDHKRYLHCLLLSVTTPQDLMSNPQYVIVDEKLEKSKVSAVHLIHWLTITYNGATWEISRTRTVAGKGILEYCSLDETASGLIVLCHKNYSFIEDVTVWMNIGSTTKKDLKVQVTAQELSVHVQDHHILFGHLSNPVQADLVTWILNDDKLELTLPKASEGVVWQGLFDSSDMHGEEVLDPQMVEEVNQRLAHLTSDLWNPNPDAEKPPYNPGQLEACDEASEDLLMIRLDGSTHNISNLGQLGPTQHLFNSRVDETKVPAFCLRHDVDGILWQPSGEDTFTHVATYNAFGYVKASKTMAKFTCAAPDISYVAVADVKSHIYVFFQPEAFGGELRNRKSGKRMNTVARQLVISMKTHSEILGLHTSPNVLFVLTDQTIYAYCLRSQ
ncbi:NudC domain-containing protein 1-like, partial [Homarus americanus]